MDATNAASVVVAVIAAGAAFASQRAAANASVKNAAMTTATEVEKSRTDIEREAFNRAKGYYTDTIDRQAAEIHDLEADVVDLKSQVTTAQKQIRDLRAELDTAKRTLRRAFPDAL